MLSLSPVLFALFGVVLLSSGCAQTPDTGPASGLNSGMVSLSRGRYPDVSIQESYSPVSGGESAQADRVALVISPGSDRESGPAIDILSAWRNVQLRTAPLSAKAIFLRARQNRATDAGGVELFVERSAVDSASGQPVGTSLPGIEGIVAAPPTVLSAVPVQVMGDRIQLSGPPLAGLQYRMGVGRQRGAGSPSLLPRQGPRRADLDLTYPLLKGLKVAAFADVVDPGLQGQSRCKWRVDVAFAEDLFRPLNASLKTSALRSALCGPAPVRAANSWQLSLTDDNWWGWDIHLDFFTKSVESAALVRNQEFFRYSLEGSRHLDVGDHRIFLGPLLSIQEARDGGAEEYVMSGLAWGMDLRSQSLSLRVSYKAVGGDGPELPDAFDFRFSYEIDLSS